VEETNLNTITDLIDRGYGLIGLSDHTRGIATSIASVALGSCLIEKHLTLERKDQSLDSEFSLEPHEFEHMVENAKYVWKALGHAQYDLKQCETYSYRLRRSLYAVENIEKGEPLTPQNVKSVRPNNGLHPKHYDTVLGMKAKNEIEKHTPLSWDLLTD
jgi:N-acetylneuraminate synthase